MTKRLKMLLVLMGITLAVAVWRGVTVHKAGAAPTLFSEAQNHVAKGDIDRAIGSLKTALLIEPENGEYHATLGELYLQRRAYPDAIREFQFAAHYAPKRPHLYCQLAESLVEERRRDDALIALEEADRRNPNCPHALAVRGEQLLRDDNLKGALEAFERTVQLQPDFTAAYLKIGNILLRTNQFKRAEEVLKQGLAGNPSALGLHLLLGEVVLRHANTDAALTEAERHLKLALAGGTEAARIHADLGKVYLRKKDYAAAREALLKALSLQPSLKQALYTLSQVASAERKGSEAKAYLSLFNAQQARERDLFELFARVSATPEDLGLRARAVEACLKAGQVRHAERLVERGVQIDPAHRELRELRAQVLLMQQHPDQARREFEIAAQLPAGP